MNKRLTIYLKTGSLRIDRKSITGHVYVLSPHQVKLHSKAKEVRKSHAYLTTEMNCGRYYIQLKPDELEYLGIEKS